MLILLVAGPVRAQTQTDKQGYAPWVNSQGNGFKQLRPDSALHLPHKYGLTLNTTDSTPQIFAWSTPTGDSLILYVNGRYIIIGAGANVKNMGNANGIQTGPFLSRPLAGHLGNFYGSTDSLRWSFDNGTGWVDMGGSGGGSAGVISFNTRTGAVTLLLADVLTALGYVPVSTLDSGYTKIFVSPEGLQKTIDSMKIINDARYAQRANNLSDLTNAGTARTNLGLGTAAVKNTPTSGDATGTDLVNAGDSRLTNSRPPNGTAGGDLSGSYPNPGVAGILGHALPALSVGYPHWNGSAWVFDTPAGGGNISQIYSKDSVIAILGTDSLHWLNKWNRAPEQDYGYLYSRYNGNFTANDWVAVGNAAASFSGGNMGLSSSNTGNQSNYLYLRNYRDSISQLSRDSVSYGLKVVTTGTGVGIGTKSVNLHGLAGDFDLWVNTSSSPVQIGLLNTNGGATVLVSLTNGPTFSPGDSLEGSVWWADSVLKGNVRNVTTGSSTTTITYNYTVASSGAATPAVARHVLYTFGGTQTVYKYNIYSRTPKYATLLLAGDSKYVGYYANFWNTRTGPQLNATYPAVTVWAGGSDQIADLLNGVQQLLALSPQQVLLNIGSNQLRYGTSVAQTEYLYDSLVNILTGAGIKVYHIVPPEDSTIATPAANHLTDFKNYVASKYASTYMDVWTGTSTANVFTSTYSYTDGIHWKQAMEDYVAAAAVSSGLLTPYPTAQRVYQIQDVDQYHRLTGSGSNAKLSLDIGAVRRDVSAPPGTIGQGVGYVTTSTIGGNGYYDDGSTTTKLGTFQATAPHFGYYKGGSINPNNGLLYGLFDANLNSFNSLVISLPGASTNNKQYAFTNNGAAFHFYKLGDASGLTAIFDVSTSGLTVNNVSFNSGGVLLVNTGTSDGTSKLQVSGAFAATNMGLGGTVPATDAQQLLGAGTTTLSPIRWVLTSAALRTTPNAGAEEAVTDDRYYTISTGNQRVKYLFAEPSAGLTSGRVPFATTNGRLKDDAGLVYSSATGLQLSTILRKLLDTTSYKPMVVDGSGNVVKTDWATFAGASGYNQIQLNSSSSGLTQRAKLNFSTDFTAADNSGNGSTDIGVKNFYNSDGTLPGDRTVNIGAHTINLLGSGVGSGLFNDNAPTFLSGGVGFIESGLITNTTLDAQETILTIPSSNGAGITLTMTVQMQGRFVILNNNNSHASTFAGTAVKSKGSTITTIAANTSYVLYYEISDGVWYVASSY